MDRNNELKEQYNYIAPGNNEVITQNEVVRDLGLLVNPQGNYNDHIAKVYSKVSQRAGLMLRTFEDRSITHMKFIWKVYLQPLIDYCSQLYSPIAGGQLYRLESLLESFTAKIGNMKDIHYWNRLSTLKMYSINRRFERYRILYCYKIVKGLTQNCGLSWSVSKQNGLLFDIPKFKKYYKEARKQSFCYMGPLLFNSLPVYLRNDMTKSIEEWKHSLDIFLQSIPDNPITLKCPSGLLDFYSAKPTNSITRWIPHLGLSARRSTIDSN